VAPAPESSALLLDWLPNYPTQSFAPAGKTPVALTVGGMRQKLSMIATVTNQASVWPTHLDPNGAVMARRRD